MYQISRDILIKEKKNTRFTESLYKCIKFTLRSCVLTKPHSSQRVATSVAQSDPLGLIHSYQWSDSSPHPLELAQPRADADHVLVFINRQKHCRMVVYKIRVMISFRQIADANRPLNLERV